MCTFFTPACYFWFFCCCFFVPTLSTFIPCHCVYTKGNLWKFVFSVVILKCKYVARAKSRVILLLRMKRKNEAGHDSFYMQFTEQNIYHKIFVIIANVLIPSNQFSWWNFQQDVGEKNDKTECDKREIDKRREDERP